MPAPTNISFATATDLGFVSTTPTVVTQQADFGGTTFSLYFKITVPLNATVVGSFGLGDLTVYKPVLTPYNSAHVAILTISATNVPIQFPVTGGDSYFLELVPNGGNPSPANLTLTITVAPNNTILSGDIGVNDDTIGHPLAFVASTTNYLARRFINNIVAGESGDTLDNGIVLLEDADTGDAVLYDSAYNVLATITLPAGIVGERGDIRAHVSTQKFYVGNSQNPGKFLTVSSTGVASSLTTLTGAGLCDALAANTAETILYFGGGPLTPEVKRWDITNGVLLSDLAAGLASYRISDIIYLSDNTILTGFFGADYQILRYSTTGTVLNTYSFPAYVISTPRINRAIDTPNSFWVMLSDFPQTLGTRTFTNVKISDGSTIAARKSMLSERGEWTGAASTTPPATFMASASCPFWLVHSSTSPAGTGSGLYKLTGTNINNSRVDHDKEWVDAGLGTTVDVAIPNPFAESYLVGDE